jgi:hypothetical protein
MDYAYIEGERGSTAAQYVFDILHGADPMDLPMASLRTLRSWSMGRRRIRSAS